MKAISEGPQKYASLLLILCLSTFVLIGAYNIDKPGLYYDEALFVNAATGGETDLFVFKRLGDLPVMLMPYIGALKAWLYYPIFKIFEIDYLSIRLPAILIGALALGLMWKYTQYEFGTKAASIFIIMACVEPSSIFHSRLDWGPTALMMAFRGGLLLSLAYWFRTGNSKYITLALICFGLGTFDKLNFIWIASAAFAAGVLIYRHSFNKLNIFKNKKYIIGTSLLLIVLFASYLQIFGIKVFEEISIANLGSRFSEFIRLLALTMRGEGIYQFVIQGENKAFDLHAYALMVTSFLALWGIYRGIHEGKLSVRPLAYLALVILLLATQVYFTKKATGPHHFATLSPLWLIFIAVGLNNALMVLQKHGSVLAKALIGLPIFFVVATSLNAATVYHESFKELIGNPHWDPSSSTELTKTLLYHDVNSIVAVDWGVATNVQALSNNQIKVFDFWPLFNEGMDEQKLAWIRSEFLEKGATFVLHTEGREAFPVARRNFIHAARNSGWSLQRFAVIKTMDGNPYIELYKSI